MASNGAIEQLDLRVLSHVVGHDGAGLVGREPVTNFVKSNKQIATDGTLQGGGQIGSDLTLGLSSASVASLERADSAMQPSVYDPESVGGEMAFKATTATADQGVKADSALQPGDVPIYGTVSDLSSLSIPAGANAIRLNGFYNPGDGGAWPLAIEVSNTGDVQPWQRQSNDGTRRWQLVTTKPDVRMFGAISDGSIDCLTAFNNAAAFVGNWGLVRVSAGSYNVSAQTTGNAWWYIDPQVTITGLPSVPVGSGSVINDTSRLTGKVVDLHSGGTKATGIRIGDPRPWMSTSVRNVSENTATFTVISDTGAIAILGGTRVSDSLGGSAQAISATCYNDDTTGRGGWSIYAHSVKASTATGTLFGMEADMVNLATVVETTPFEIKSGMTANAWLSCGGGSSMPALTPLNDITMAIGILPNPNGFRTGITFFNGAITGANKEAINSPTGLCWGWWESSTIRRSYLDDRIHHRTVNNDTAATCALDESRRTRTSGTATAANDLVYRHTFFAWNGTSYVEAGYHQVQQITTYSSSRARFAQMWEANNGDGTFAVVGLNLTAANSFGPQSDNAISLGVAAARFSIVYAGTGTISTSDAREKTDPLAIDDAVLDAWGDVSLVTFRWLQAIAEKGDAARWHFGVIAQQVRDAFAARGLEGTHYGLLCYDQWEEEKAPVYENVEKTVQREVQSLGADGQPYTFTIDEVVSEQNQTGEQIVRKAGDRWGIRPDQCLFLEAAYQRRRSDRLEARIAALEGNQK